MKSLLNLTFWLPIVMMACLVISFIGALFGQPSLLVGWPLWVLIGMGTVTMALSIGGRFLTDYAPPYEQAAFQLCMLGFLAVFVPTLILSEPSLMSLLQVVLPLVASAAVAGWLMYISGRKRYEISKRQWYKQAIRDKVQNTACLQSYSANVADWTDDRHETATLEDRYNTLRALIRANQDTLTARNKLQG